MIFGGELCDFYLSESGFSGCYWMIFGGELCDFYLSESGYSGFKDLQDVGWC